MVRCKRSLLNEHLPVSLRSESPMSSVHQQGARCVMPSQFPSKSNWT